MRMAKDVITMTAVMLRGLVFTFLCVFVLGGLVHGQSFDAPALASYCNGIEYGVAQQANLATIAPPYNTLMYGPQFSCTIPVTCPLCMVTMGFMEDRSDPTLIGPGQRLFTVMLNGNVSDVIDLFSLAGPLTPTARTWIIPVYNQKLTIIFSATKLNALVSTITIANTPMTSPCGVNPVCAFVSHEVPSGVIDGMNTVFMLLGAPSYGTEHMYLNGLLLFNTIDYTINGYTITFMKAPPPGSIIQVDYQAT